MLITDVLYEDIKISNNKEENKMKKTISILASVIMAASALTTPGIALDYDTPVEQEIVEEYAIFNSLGSSLSISGNMASCTSIANASNAVSITATQKLQKYSGWFWFWDDVATWTETQNREIFATANTATGLSSGKYRLVTIFTVTSATGQTETATATSFEDTVS